MSTDCSEQAMGPGDTDLDREQLAGETHDPPVTNWTTDVRQSWGKKLEFVLACIGYSVGLGNVWRFPYLSYSSGGGAFLIPFFLMLIICGIPLMYMELAIGQYTRQGPIGAIGKLCPFFKGAGLATVVVSYLFTTYYNIIITWSFYYLFNTFTSLLPWTHCNHTWSSPTCWDSGSVNTTAPNNTISPTENFFMNSLLQKTPRMEEQGVIRWELVLLLMLCWLLVYFCIWKGPKSTGKVVYVTAIFPYIVLFILLIRGVTLPGAKEGILFFIKPKWYQLADAKVWMNAAIQNFNSLGIAFGGLITMSSYNKFSNNIIKDVICLALIDAFTCIMAGFAIFSILGALAVSQGKTVEDVVTEGPGLVFIIYPQAFSEMPVAQLFAFLFFLMLICLGIDSQFAGVEVVVTALQDHFAPQIKKYLKRKELLVLLVCLLSFLGGLPNVTQGGIYFFQLIDRYAAGVSVMYLAFFEVIAVTWFYGAKRLGRNIQEMTGNAPSFFFILCWYYVSPLFILAILIFSMVQYSDLEVGGYVYPKWAIGIGWFITSLSLVCIPLGMIDAVYNSKGNNLWQKFRNSLTSPIMEESMTMELCNKERSRPNLDTLKASTM
ncbi:sodiumchlorideine-likedependent and chloride-dependent GABA transporter ine-like [Octopus vulgaris]|uniref:Transporter n=1 Tax=Octopus vulgaris TaxID=6645 RepID=A0AA36C145_OCTVU|nr:sodiumchlorideine-likedependent and chloride-dependent GABA transporter ine-like [Octopus vulgaris]